MKLQYNFICLCCGATLLYLICFYSNFKEKVIKHQDVYSTFKSTKIINDNLILLKNIFNKTREINNTQIEPLEKFDECLSFVSASCDYGSMKTKFKKLPEKFAKVNSLSCFITILVTNFYCNY